jgi:virginiamycin B lyase
VSARDFRPLFIALLFGVSASAYSQTNLPEGAGREIVQSKCAGCHELGRVLRSGYSAQDWRTVVHMMNNVGAQVPDEQLPILVKYLAENFPEKPRPQGPVIAGPTQVVFKEWVLPIPGSRPHDPLATLDESICTLGRWRMCWGA